LKVNIYNKSKNRDADKVVIKNITRTIVAAEEFTCTCINIIIEKDAYLQKLNKRFFNRNSPTNVIAFDMDDICEIYVSIDQIGCKEDLYYFIIHGLLHLAGYDHKSTKEAVIMKRMCNKYLRYYRAQITSKKGKVCKN
jgi:probable rRNA maturation factor